MSADCRKTCSVGQAKAGRISGTRYQGEIQVDVPNQRVFVKNHLEHQPCALIKEAEALAADNCAGKIIFFAKPELAVELDTRGYVREGEIPLFYNGLDALCYARFLAPARSYSHHLADEEDRKSVV